MEFAVLSPVLILLLFGLLDLGRAYYFEVVTTDAARDAARDAIGFGAGSQPSGGAGLSDVCAKVTADLANAGTVASCTLAPANALPASGRPYYGGAPTPPAGQAVVWVSCPQAPDAANCRGALGSGEANVKIGVTIYYNFTLLTPGMVQLFGNSIVMSNAAVMLSLW